MQERAGVRDKTEQIGRKILRAVLIDQHRAFYAELPTLYLGHLDEHGRPWASILTGPPGFLSTPDDHTLAVATSPVDGDRIRLEPGAQVGAVGTQLQTRRRNRVNGTLGLIRDDGFTIDVFQAFGNCPKYIRRRAPSAVEPAEPQPAAQSFAGLDDAARQQITRADTFFVASAATAAQGLHAHTVDMSHRGGHAGFVRMADERTLVVPDYAGNNAFNTLGNFVVNPVAGLLFVDFATGDVLQLTGRVQLVLEGPQIATHPGAQRLWTVTVEEGRRLPGRVPLRWEDGEHWSGTPIP
ncbi:MAG: pyridoxamine 5'-phosphate oxidase family protein [Myxococcales bacterium]|nr:pyridoxamine 5'-phosphate oxidase family protein [Myxococcales bacterium]